MVPHTQACSFDQLCYLHPNGLPVRADSATPLRRPSSAALLHGATSDCIVVGAVTGGGGEQRWRRRRTLRRPASAAQLATYPPRLSFTSYSKLFADQMSMSQNNGKGLPPAPPGRRRVGQS